MDFGEVALLAVRLGGVVWTVMEESSGDFMVKNA
jgi:hypothetical protein